MEHHAPKISVVMPVLNGKPYVDAALESVQAQTLRDIEIIVVDAGSTDGTLELLQQKCKEDPRIRVLASDQRSMGRQYNLGLAATRGRYLAICEDDDEMVPDFLENAYAAAQEHAFPDMVRFDFLLFRGDGEDRYEMRYSALPTYARKALCGKIVTLADCPELLRHDANQWNAIYRCDFLREQGILWNETPGAACQDTGFVQQTLLTARSILYLPGLAYRYRLDNADSSIYKATAPYWFQELRFVMKKFLTHPDWKPYAAKMLHQSFNQFCVAYARDCFLGQNMMEEKSLRTLQVEIASFLHWMGFCIDSQIDLPFLLSFLEDIRAFRRQVIGWQIAYRDAVVTFRNALRDEDTLVIFSTSERGMAMRAFLHRNQFSGRVVFCDNDAAAQGMQFLATDVYSPQEAARKFPEALFLIPMPEYRLSMRAQLITIGISGDRIMDAFFIDPWAAFMVDWETV